MQPMDERGTLGRLLWPGSYDGRASAERLHSGRAGNPQAVRWERTLQADGGGHHNAAHPNAKAERNRNLKISVFTPNPELCIRVLSFCSIGWHLSLPWMGEGRGSLHREFKFAIAGTQQASVGYSTSLSATEISVPARLPVVGSTRTIP